MPTLNLGTNTPQKIYLGNTQVQKVYHGNTLIYTYIISFYLSQDSRVSIGIYKNDGTDDILVRTLISGKQMSTGQQKVDWDGTDDRLQTLAVDNYKIKILSNNVIYAWEGVIGNTSISQYGQGIHTSFEIFDKMVITGGKAYYSVGYNEGNSDVAAFDLTNIQVRQNVYGGFGGWVTSNQIATDGTNIYITAYDSYHPQYSFLYVRKVSDNSPVTYSSGVPYDGQNIHFDNVIDLRTTTYKPTGITVSSTYIFISYQVGNIISVLNKTTGALVREISITAPSSLTLDGTNIWIATGNNTVKKYPLNSDGSLGTAALTLTGFSNVIDLKVNGSLLAVVDGGTNNTIKTYTTGSGATSWTLGQTGGMTLSPLVQDDKFLFNGRGGICFAPDGSFWVIDSGNFRMQHYDANRTLIDFIAYMPHTRSCAIVGNQNTRVLGNDREYEIEYTKSLATGWKLKYNWTVNLTDYNAEGGITGVNKLSNGRTYGLVIRESTNQKVVVELDPVNGIRYTNSVLNLSDYQAIKMYPDGSVYAIGGTAIGETERWIKNTLTSFDNNHDPVYSQSVLPVTLPVIAKEPKLSGPRPYPYEKTSSNILVLFKAEAEGTEDYTSYHLGGMDATTGKMMFRTSRATFPEYKGAYPPDGSFDVRDDAGYKGTVALAIERNIFWGYNGEGVNSSQISKYNHYFDNGLFIGQFGTTGPEYNADPVNNPGFAGNDYYPEITKVGNDYYIYHTDESVHGGLHRRKISNLSSIQEQVIPITSTFIRSDERVLPTGMTDLMAGLPYRSNALTNNTAGWSYTPTLSQFWQVKTTEVTYDVRKPFDIGILYQTYQGSNNGINTVSRSLGSNIGLNTWQLSGTISYNGQQPNFFDQNGANIYLDILDNTGKIISRFYQIDNHDHDRTWFRINNTDIFNLDQQSMQNFCKPFRPFSFTKSGSSISANYAGYTASVTTPFETGANISNPTVMRIYIYNGNGENSIKYINLIALFNNNPTLT